MAKGKLKSVDDVIYDDVVRISKPPAGPDDGQSTDAVSIGDVARMAGVAPITVSRALSKPQKVSAEKRARIQQAVEATGYRVNPFASALRSGRSNVVMAFASNMFSEQFSLALHACGNILEKAGYLFLVGQTAYSYDRETAAIRSLQALKPAAVMFTGVIELEENRDILKNLGIPIMETWALPRDPIDMLVGFSNTEAGLYRPAWRPRRTAPPRLQERMSEIRSRSCWGCSWRRYRRTIRWRSLSHPVAGGMPGCRGDLLR